MSPRIVDKQQKRRSIVEASLRVFGRKGYQTSRMSDIAQEAGIGKGTIYEYFKSKDELIQAIFEDLFVNYEQRLYQLAQRDGSPVEAILKSLMQMLEEADEYADLVSVSFELWGSKTLSENLGLNEQMSKWLEQLSGAYVSIIEKGQKSGEINPAIDARALARTLVSAMDGIILHYCLFRPHKSFYAQQQKELERMVRSVLRSHQIEQT